MCVKWSSPSRALLLSISLFLSVSGQDGWTAQRDEERRRRRRWRSVCDVFLSSLVTRRGCLCVESVLFTAGDKLIEADSSRDRMAL